MRFMVDNNYPVVLYTGNPVVEYYIDKLDDYIEDAFKIMFPTCMMRNIIQPYNIRPVSEQLYEYWKPAYSDFMRQRPKHLCHGCGRIIPCTPIFIPDGKYERKRIQSSSYFRSKYVNVITSFKFAATCCGNCIFKSVYDQVAGRCFEYCSWNCERPIFQKKQVPRRLRGKRITFNFSALPESDK